jgi:hypothetical protein
MLGLCSHVRCKVDLKMFITTFWFCGCLCEQRIYSTLNPLCLAKYHGTKHCPLLMTCGPVAPSALCVFNALNPCFCHKYNLLYPALIRLACCHSKECTINSINELTGSVNR